ncbi:hypothetical protein GCM10009789_61540 [Kribbella sancticallisti]|uniref:DUF2000 domain-containing protein n=1 Tax=Kribbella sancticallisti TaxID=460087 RepID=A0ABN2E809_9ACTN
MLANKMVVVLDPNVPVGVALNAAALLGVGLGSQLPDLIGEGTPDGSGGLHPGICVHPIPILKADAARLRELRAAAASRDGIEVHDINQVARTSRTYEQYLATMSGTKEEDLEYVGLAIYGPRTAVNSLTGALALYR